VVGARDPDGALGLEDAARLLEPPEVELVIPHESLRANGVTTPGLALPDSAGRRRSQPRTPKVEQRSNSRR
jgi:hypothetical protein